MCPEVACTLIFCYPKVAPRGKAPWRSVLDESGQISRRQKSISNTKGTVGVGSSHLVRQAVVAGATKQSRPVGLSSQDVIGKAGVAGSPGKVGQKASSHEK